MFFLQCTLILTIASVVSAKIVPGLYTIRSAYKTGVGYAGQVSGTSTLPVTTFPPIWNVTAGASGRDNAYRLVNVNAFAATDADEVVAKTIFDTEYPFEWFIRPDTARGSDYYTIQAYDEVGAWTLSTDTTNTIVTRRGNLYSEGFKGGGVLHTQQPLETCPIEISASVKAANCLKTAINGRDPKSQWYLAKFYLSRKICHKMPERSFTVVIAFDRFAVFLFHMKLSSSLLAFASALFATSSHAKLAPGTYEIRSAYKTSAGFAGENITPSPLPPPSIPPVITDFTGNNVSVTWTVTAGSSGKANAFVLQNLNKAIAFVNGDEVGLEKTFITPSPPEWNIAEDTARGADYYSITAYDGSGRSWILSTDEKDRFGYVLADLIFLPTGPTSSWQFIPVKAV
ncbi:hypothetical protein DL96DRAFT_1780019 [Flagelloscypha sp. PMI_526]|nr:hypothetical protein DL96DRAFT_1780019 [Flagelloscypha sp. PMI_526]